MFALLSLKTKLIIGGIIILLISGGVFYLRNLQTVNKKQQETIVEQKVAIKQNEKAIDVTTKIQQITQEVNTTVVKDQKQIAETKQRIDAKVDAKIAVIQTAFQSKPVLPDTATQKAQEISTVYIDALWESFCTIKTIDAGCINSTH